MAWETREQMIGQLDTAWAVRAPAGEKDELTTCPSCGRVVPCWAGMKVAPHGDERGPCRGELAHERIDRLVEAVEALAAAVDILNKRTQGR